MIEERPLESIDQPFSLEFGRAMGRVVVKVVGPLNRATAPELRARLDDLIDGQGNLRFVVDLRDTTTLDRSGISVLVEALKRVQGNAGSLVLNGPGPAVVQALAGAGVLQAFTVTAAWAHPAYAGDDPVLRNWPRSG